MKKSTAAILSGVAVTSVAAGLMVASNNPTFAQEADTQRPSINQMHGQGRRGGAMHVMRDISPEVAEMLGLTEDEMKDALQSGSTIVDLANQQDADLDAITVLIEDALLTKLEESDMDEDKKTELTENVDDLIEKILTTSPEDRKGQGHRRGGMHAMREASPDIASLLGMTEEEMKEELISGKSISDLVDEAGADLTEVSATIKEALLSNLEEAEDMDDDKKAEITEDADEIVEKILNGVRGGGRRGGIHMNGEEKY